MTAPDCPRIKVQDTKGTSLAIQFDHFDVSGEDWIEVFRLTLLFLGFGNTTIVELLGDGENGGNENTG